MVPYFRAVVQYEVTCACKLSTSKHMSIPIWIRKRFDGICDPQAPTEYRRGGTAGGLFFPMWKSAVSDGQGLFSGGVKTLCTCRGEKMVDEAQQGWKGTVSGRPEED